MKCQTLSSQEINENKYCKMSSAVVSANLNYKIQADVRYVIFSLEIVGCHFMYIQTIHMIYQALLS